MKCCLFQTQMTNGLPKLNSNVIFVFFYRLSDCWIKNPGSFYALYFIYMYIKRSSWSLCCEYFMVCCLHAVNWIVFSWYFILIFLADGTCKFWFYSFWNFLKNTLWTTVTLFHSIVRKYGWLCKLCRIDKCYLIVYLPSVILLAYFLLMR